MAKREKGKTRKVRTNEQWCFRASVRLSISIVIFVLWKRIKSILLLLSFYLWYSIRRASSRTRNVRCCKIASFSFVFSWKRVIENSSNNSLEHETREVIFIVTKHARFQENSVMWYIRRWDKLVQERRYSFHLVERGKFLQCFIFAHVRVSKRHPLS